MSFKGHPMPEGLVADGSPFVFLEGTVGENQLLRKGDFSPLTGRGGSYRRPIASRNIDVLKFGPTLGDRVFTFFKAQSVLLRVGSN
jgi:hypothetical protein